MLGYLVAPLVALTGALPSTEPAAYFSGGVPEAMATSLGTATVATLADGLLGIPLGLWLARTTSSWRHLVTGLVLLPLAVPPVVGGLILLIWLGPQGWLGAMSPVNTPIGSVLAQMFVAAPFVVVSARAAFLAVDPGLEQTARSLGCTPAAALFRVVLPLARRGLATGLVLGWVRCLGEFGATAIVAYHPYTLSILTYVRVTGEGIRTALPAGLLAALIGAGAAAAVLWLDAAQLRRRPRSEVEAGLPPMALGWIQPVEPAAGLILALRADVVLDSFRLDVSFESARRVTAILGPSGAGKSLTAAVFTGLIGVSSGSVEVRGRTLLDTAAGIDLPPERRRLAYVPQRDSLFDHLDIEGNVGFGIRQLPAAVRSQRVGELLAAVGVEGLRHARPATLSGGERQRATLARALAISPAALVLDEPFGSLDPPLRSQLRRLVGELVQRSGLPVLMVTHDREDVLELADEVVVLQGGRVAQSGPMTEVFSRPANRGVARLLGIPNVVQVSSLRPQRRGAVDAVTGWGALPVRLPEVGASGWELAIPADAVSIDLGGQEASVAAARPDVAGWRLWLVGQNGAEPLEVLVPRAFGETLAPGTPCAALIDPSRCHLMPTD